MNQRNALIASAVLGLLGSTNAMALESGFYLGVVGAHATADVSKSEYDALEQDPSATSFSSSLDKSDTSIGIALGGQFGRWFALEAQLINLGELQYSSSQSVPYFSSPPTNVDVRYRETLDASAATLSGILTVPLGEHFAVGFRLGLAANVTEANYELEARRGNNTILYETDSNDADASDTGATYGISFEWAPTTHVGVRLEYQVIQNVGGEDDDYDFELDGGDIYYDDVPEQDGRDVDLVSLSLFWRF